MAAITTEELICAAAEQQHARAATVAALPNASRAALLLALLALLAMAKGLRSKVKKRLRTVKRGVVKRELADPSSKLGVRNTAIHKKLEEALSGYLKPEVRARNAFRYDDADAVVPQHNWRQGPDFRSDRVEDAGYACVGSNRPKFPHGRDGPTARVDDAPAPEGAEGDDAPMPAPPVPDDPAVRRLRVGTEQLTTKGAAKRLKRRMKQKGVDHNVFRWT